MKDIVYQSAEEALRLVHSGDHLYWPCVAASPQLLLRALVARGTRNELHDVSMFHLHTEGYAGYTDPEQAGHFHLDSIFVGENVRAATHRGQADYIPCSLSDVGRFIREEILPVDGVLLMVSEPQADGTVSIGTSVDVAREALSKARYVIAQVNSHMPYTYGDTVIPIDCITAFVRGDEPLVEAAYPELSEVDMAIGRYASELIPDGATLQIGIGKIPNAVLAQLYDRRNLGIHSEMFSDGAIPLIDRGIINGSRKVTDVGKHVATFLKGSTALYRYVDHNDTVAMRSVAYTNNPRVIAQNPAVIALNSAIQVDLSGQVCADSLGPKIYSGSGGQLDFMLGAAWSPGGVPITAMPSMTGRGVSKIVPLLTEGAGVVTPRTCVHWVITEHGRVNLYGKPLHQRARLLISIAHPSVRDELTYQARQLGLI